MFFVACENRCESPDLGEEKELDRNQQLASSKYFIFIL